MCNENCKCAKDFDMEVFFAKLKEDAKIPEKLDEDAGWDLYACFEQDELVIQEGETVMIPTGLISAYSKGYMALVKERGSTGTRAMSIRAGVFDSGFRNEWKVVINNTGHKVVIISKDPKKTRAEQYKNFKAQFYDRLSKEKKKTVKEIDYVNKIVDMTVEIYPYEKAIAQFLFLPVPKVKRNVVTVEEVRSMESKRGLGMLGSSGK